MLKRLNRWTSFLGVLTVLCHMFFLGRPVMAAGGYPYADIPCIYAPYAIQGQGVNWCPNYDFGQRRNDSSASNVISPYGYYYRNCTDYVAWRVAGLGVPVAQYRGLGNAKQWAQPAARHGLRVDGQPAVYAAGVRTSGQYGHVALVEAVNVPGYPAGSIKISEYNKRADGNYGERIGMPAQLGLTHFVHFEDYIPAPVVLQPAPEPPIVPAPAPASPTATVPQQSNAIIAGPTPAMQPDADKPAPGVTAAGPAPAGIPAANAGVDSIVDPGDVPGGAPAADTVELDRTASASDTTTAPDVSGLDPRQTPVVEPTSAGTVAATQPIEAPANTEVSTAPVASKTNTQSKPAAIPEPQSMLQEETTVSAAVLATALPVPHKWWQEIAVSPPAASDMAFGQQAIQNVTVQAGIWMLGGLMAILVLQEYGLVRSFGIRLRILLRP